jgi:hypothetical protein
LAGRERHILGEWVNGWRVRGDKAEMEILRKG